VEQLGIIVEQLRVILEQVSVLDIVIVCLFIVSIVIGYLRGFVKQLVSIVGWFIAYLVAYLFYDDMAPVLQSWVPFSSKDALTEYSGIVSDLRIDTYIYNAIAFALLFFGSRMIITVVGYFLHGVVSLPGIRFFNRLGGVLLALVEAAVIVIIGLIVLEALPSERIAFLLDHSLIAGWLRTYAANLLLFSEF
jgi:uncharacterized membrane protein required for colicin V production